MGTTASSSVDRGPKGRGGKGGQKEKGSADLLAARAEVSTSNSKDRMMAKMLEQHPLLSAALRSVAESGKPVTKAQAAAHGLTRRAFKDLLVAYKGLRRRGRR